MEKTSSRLVPTKTQQPRFNTQKEKENAKFGLKTHAVER
jgi:hypothetical protein